MIAYSVWQGSCHEQLIDMVKDNTLAMFPTSLNKGNIRFWTTLGYSYGPRVACVACVACVARSASSLALSRCARSLALPHLGCTYHAVLPVAFPAPL